MTLPPELERFAAEAVAAGHYRDIAAVVAAGISLLQHQETARADLLTSVLAAEAEAARVSGDEMLPRVRAGPGWWSSHPLPIRGAIPGVSPGSIPGMEE